MLSYACVLFEIAGRGWGGVGWEGGSFRNAGRATWDGDDRKMLSVAFLGIAYQKKFRRLQFLIELKSNVQGLSS